MRGPHGLRGLRSLRALFLVVLAAIAGLLLPASPVFAHAQFLGSSPADGSVLPAAPASVTLRFSEPVLASASSVTLLVLGTGNQVSLAPVAPGDGTTLVVELPPGIATGAYLLRFTAIDPSDLHKTVGAVSFGVGVEAPAPAASAQVDSPWWATVLRAITAALLVAVVGAAVVIASAVRRGVPVPKRCAQIAQWATAALSLGWIGLFLADVAGVGFVHARWGSLLVSSGPGRRALLGAVTAGAMWWVVDLLATALDAALRFVSRLVVVFAVALVALAALSGHTGVGGDVSVGVLLRAVHIGSLCAWIGAVAVTWWVHRSSADDDVRVLWPDVSRVAAVGIAGTGVSGLLLSARVVDTLTGLLGTAYGRALVAKVVMMVALGVVGFLAARRVAGGFAPRGMTIELALAAIALSLAAYVAGAAPAVGVRFAPLAEAVPQVVTGDLADLTVNVSVQPSRPGPNLLRVRVLDTRRPPLGPVSTVTVRVRRGDGTEVDARSATPVDGVVEWPDVQLASPGAYTVVVGVDRPAAPVPELDADVEVAGTPVPRAATVVSNADWAPLALGGAAVWLVAVGAGRWVSQRRRVLQASNR